MAKTTKIIIESGDHNSSTPLIINGIVVRRIKHDEPTDLNDIELEVLRNSTRSFRIVPANGGEATDEAESGGASASSESSALILDNTHLDETVEAAGRTFSRDEFIRAAQRASGLDVDGFNALQPNDREARLNGFIDVLNADPSRADDMTMLEGGLASTGDTTRPDTDVDDAEGGDPVARVKREAKERESLPDDAGKAKAEATEAERLDAARRNGESEGSGSEADKEEAERRKSTAGAPFKAATVLEGSIATITEGMDAYTPRQLRALLDAENKAEKPRAGLISAIEKKLAPAE